MNKEETNFEKINYYLSNVKNEYLFILDSMYKEKYNLTFLFGKQFRTFMKNLESGFNTDGFLRYILNITDNNVFINKNIIDFPIYKKNFIKDYIKYFKNYFDSISKYITSLFNNNKTLEEHYNSMKIIPENIYKGIYMLECHINDFNNYTINLFIDKVGQLPLAQNVLITSKETSYEEIQSFFHRAILCKYNNLFVVELNNSFSEYQQALMYNNIKSLLEYKNRIYNEETNQNVNKNMIKNYLNSCIVFILDKRNKYNSNYLKFKFKAKYLEVENSIKENNNNEKLFSSLKRNSKLINKTNKDINISQKKHRKNKIEILKLLKEKNIINLFPELEKIKIISSEISGLGKSRYIQKLINDSHKKIIYISIGDIITISILFNKLKNLLNKIQNLNYKDFAIHLDLSDSKEIDLLNEFLFSFLITKFYIYNEDIIYIPIDIFIYIELPNRYENFLSKFTILNIFNKENITIENIVR